MRRRMATLICTLVLVSSLCLLPGSAWGDAGHYSGSSNYGGGGGGGWSGSSSSGNYGSGSSGGFFYVGDGSSSDNGGGDGAMGIIITILVIGAVVFFMARGYSKASHANQPAGASPTAQDALKPLDTLLQEDPAFKEEDLRMKISNLYVQMQNAWTAKDFTPMQHYFTDELYTQFDRQLDAMRKGHQTNRIDDIAVLGVELRGWYEAEDNQCVVANVRTRIIDYVVDDASGSVVSGSDKAEKFMTYEYTLIRTRGTLTRTQTDETEATLCPNCGAPIDINQTAKCSYCGSIVKAKDFDWVISSIKGLSQQSVG